MRGARGRLLCRLFRNREFPDPHQACNSTEKSATSSKRSLIVLNRESQLFPARYAALRVGRPSQWTPLARICLFFPCICVVRHRDRFEVDCVRHHALDRNARFPRTRRMTPMWRRFAWARCLWRRLSESRRPFRSHILSFSRRQIPFPGNSDGDCGDRFMAR